MKQNSNILSNLNSFPRIRMRRNRMKSFSRRLVNETTLSVDDLIYPIFITFGQGKKEKIKSMPGIYRFSLDLLKDEIKYISSLNIPAIAFFPMIENNLKNSNGNEAFNKDNLICRAIKVSKKINPQLGIICDVALDPYTDHGHDGILVNNEIDNDKTLEILCKQALVQAEAGCDIIAPSDMMDGRVGSIRDSLDYAGYQNVQIMSYAVKYASAFYGPFRDAVGSSMNLSSKKNKKSYQMDPANSEEAIKEVSLDLSEGADMIIIKPGMPYLDIIYMVKQKFKIPVYAYQVSGEYSMIKGAIENGWLDEKKVIMESLMAFKRAGCSGIITYFAPFIAKQIINEKNK